MFRSPFILTHTTDMHLETPGRDTDYKSRVTLKDIPRELHAKVAWNGLVSMGRPLWNAVSAKDVAVASQQKIVSDLAAKKLLRGQSISCRASYNGSTMFGVASVLCRLGLRPRSDTLLSMRAVAGFMGVLSYIFIRNDEYLTCYPPEPALAFGAARLWYQLQSTTDQPTALEEFMMPRFRDMILEDALDMTDATTDTIAARIFLLLAIDDTIMRSSKAKTLDKCGFVFTGQFCTVGQLLHTLGGAHPVLKTSWLGDPTEEQKQDHREWVTSWADWKAGFSQFHDFQEEPTEEVLWFLLDRRAAGVPCMNEKRAHVVIPIFSGDTVSYILVHVKRRLKDVGLSSTIPKLLPSRVFEGTNPLSQIHPRKMIRICIILCEEATLTVPEQMYVEATTKREWTRQQKNSSDFNKSSAYALCLRAVCRPSETIEPAAQKPWSFLSSGMSKWLETIINVEPGDVEALILSDIKACCNSASAARSEIFTAADFLESLRHATPR